MSPLSPLTVQADLVTEFIVKLFILQYLVQTRRMGFCISLETTTILTSGFLDFVRDHIQV